ncbi:hypothetical protein ElyMa_001901700 [Elysia marginata]|uniref:C2H2-type domain-containing protein n=1 Tax=Elysia marginata TaxID=1093978 RepID=A0AAV4ESC0_9GAST|nr:hypothetical protein ElyMa_001901700 [Elysia marginata]
MWKRLQQNGADSSTQVWGIGDRERQEVRDRHTDRQGGTLCLRVRQTDRNRQKSKTLKLLTQTKMFYKGSNPHPTRAGTGRFHVDDEEEEDDDANPSSLPSVRCDTCDVRFSDPATLESHKTLCGGRGKIFMPYDPPANGYLHNGFSGVSRRSRVSEGDHGSPGREPSEEREEDLDSELDDAQPGGTRELENGHVDEERPVTPGNPSFKRKLLEASLEQKVRGQTRSDENFILGLRNRMLNSLHSFRDTRVEGECAGEQEPEDSVHGDADSDVEPSMQDGKRRRFSEDVSGEDTSKTSGSEDPAVTWALKMAGRGVFGDVNNVSLEPLAATRAAVSQQGMHGTRAGGDHPREGLPEEVSVFRSMLFQLQQQQLMQVQMIQQMRRQLVASGVDPKQLPADLDLSMMSSEGLASVGAAMSGLQNATAAAAARAARSGTSGPDGDTAFKALNCPDLISSTRTSAVERGGARRSRNCSPHTDEGRGAAEQPGSLSPGEDARNRDSRVGDEDRNSESRSRDKIEDLTRVTASLPPTSSSPSLPLSSPPSSSSFPMHGDLSHKYLNLPGSDLSPFSGLLASAGSQQLPSSSLAPPGRNPLEILQEKTAASLSALPLPASLSALRPPPPSTSLTSTSGSSVFPGSEPKSLASSSSMLSSSALFASSPSLSALQKETDALKPSPILPPISLPMTPEAYKGYIQRGTRSARTYDVVTEPGLAPSTPPPQA